MKQIIVVDGQVKLVEMPVPLPQKGFLKVENKYSLISSGTELTSVTGKKNLLKKVFENPELVVKTFNKLKTSGFEKTIDKIKYNSKKLGLLGYSCAGTIVESNEVDVPLKCGDRVACAGAGYANHAEFVISPKNLVVNIPENVTFKEAAFTTLGAIALQGIRRTNPEIGETIVVLGLGILGQLTVQILKANGCQTIGVDLDEKRVNKSIKLGLDKGITTDNAVEKILEYTNEIGADAVVICADTSSSSPVNQAMDMCRKKGRVIIVGSVGMNLERKEFYKKELDLKISTSYGPGRYDSQYEENGIDYPLGYVRWTEKRNMEAFLELISDKKINVKSLIEAEYPLEQAAQAYSDLQQKDKPLSVLIKYPGKKKKNINKIIVNKPRKIIKDKINIGVIGCGSFAKSVHLPNIQENPNFLLKAVSSRQPSNVINTAKQYKAEYATTDYCKILEDEEIDAILISTRHKLHAPISIKAAKNGKHILCEKPMAINKKDMKKVANIVGKNKIIYSVGFNRRYSSFSRKINEYLNDEPLVANYRVNAGYLPRNHWIHDEDEGGRIIGEGCHFFDYVNWLTNSEPEEVYAVNLNSGKFYDPNNIISSIKYHDGSIIQINYNTIGNKKLGKEYLEIFTSNQTVLLDDYKSLNINGNTFKWKRDKGHKQELEEFAMAIRGEKSNLLDINDALKTTKTTFMVIESIKKNKIIRYS